MLSFFPSLLVLEGFAPLLLRIALGSVFVFWAYRKLRSRENTKRIIGGAIEAIIGVFLIVGFLTQLAALISAIILSIHIIAKIKKKEFLTDGVNYYLILLFISLALLLTGAGFIAFDLPL